MYLYVYQDGNTKKIEEYLFDNFTFIFDNEKMFLFKELDDKKQFRIFFKKELYDTVEKIKILKNIFLKKQKNNLKKLLEDLWIIKTKNNILLFVPKEKDIDKKEGIFLIVDDVNFVTDSGIYFKKSKSKHFISLHYLKDKKFIIHLNDKMITILLSKDNKLFCNKYQLTKII